MSLYLIKVFEPGPGCNSEMQSLKKTLGDVFICRSRCEINSTISHEEKEGGGGIANHPCCDTIICHG